MKSRKYRLLALLLALVLMLAGCSIEMPTYMKMIIASYIPTHFDDMEYTRPDLNELLTSIETCSAASEESDFDQLAADLTGCLMHYYEYMTNYSLANIYYCRDTSDIYWTEEYNYFMDTESEVRGAFDQLLYTLADSEHREALETDEYFGEGFFDDYMGDSLWDETFTAMMAEESELLAEYYDLSAQGAEVDDDAFYDTYASQLGQVYAELIALRQEIAAYAGYDSYHAFAYEYYYQRDYAPEQEAAYLEQIRQELVPIYKDMYTYGVSGIAIYERSEKETLQYVESMAENMGGTVWEAFQQMEKYGLYDISYGANKYDASFETYLIIYNQPFVFLNPTESDYDFLSFAHEFGHFCNDYASYGTGAGIDVAEIFSQGMEYLSLFYAETDNSLEVLQMVSSLSVYVEQAAYADFELRAYSLTGEELTGDTLFALFEEVCVDYGMDYWGLDGRYLTTVPHFYIAPCYVFSYVVSNDAALQLYQLEQAESGTGLAVLERNLATEEYTFLAFLESAGLESPFTEGRIQAVAGTFREILGY